MPELAVRPVGTWLLVDLEPVAAPSAVLATPDPVTTVRWAKVLATGSRCLTVTPGLRVLLSILSGVAVSDQLLIPESACLLIDN